MSVSDTKFRKKVATSVKKEEKSIILNLFLMFFLKKILEVLWFLFSFLFRFNLIIV